MEVMQDLESLTWTTLTQIDFCDQIKTCTKQSPCCDKRILINNRIAEKQLMEDSNRVQFKAHLRNQILNEQYFRYKNGGSYKTIGKEDCSYFVDDKLHLECFLHCVKWQDKVSVLGYVVVQLHFRHLSFLSPFTSVWLAVLAAFQIQLVLRQMSVKAIHIQAAGAAAAAAAAQEGADRPALTGVTHGVAEHFVDLLLRWHPPVWVWGTVHPDELWRDFKQVAIKASFSRIIKKTSLWSQEDNLSSVNTVCVNRGLKEPKERIGPNSIT